MLNLSDFEVYAEQQFEHNGVLYVFSESSASAFNALLESLNLNCYQQNVSVSRVDNRKQHLEFWFSELFKAVWGEQAAQDYYKVLLARHNIV